MATIQLTTTNYNGESGKITFYPCNSGITSTDLGTYTFPHEIIDTENYEGTYDILFTGLTSGTNQRCYIQIPCTDCARPISGLTTSELFSQYNVGASVTVYTGGTVQDVCNAKDFMDDPNNFGTYGEGAQTIQIGSDNRVYATDFLGDCTTVADSYYIMYDGPTRVIRQVVNGFLDMTVVDCASAPTPTPTPAPTDTPTPTPITGATSTPTPTPQPTDTPTPTPTGSSMLPLTIRSTAFAAHTESDLRVYVSVNSGNWEEYLPDAPWASTTTNGYMSNYPNISSTIVANEGDYIRIGLRNSADQDILFGQGQNLNDTMANEQLYYVAYCGLAEPYTFSATSNNVVYFNINVNAGSFVLCNAPTATPTPTGAPTQTPTPTPTPTATPTATPTPPQTYMVQIAGGIGGPSGTACQNAQALIDTFFVYSLLNNGGQLSTSTEVLYSDPGATTPYEGFHQVFSDGTVYGTISTNGVFAFQGYCSGI